MNLADFTADFRLPFFLAYFSVFTPYIQVCGGGHIHYFGRLEVVALRYSFTKGAWAKWHIYYRTR